MSRSKIFMIPWGVFLLFWGVSCSSSPTGYTFQDSNIIDINISPGNTQRNFPLDSIVESTEYLQLNLDTQYVISIPYKFIAFNSSFLIYDLGNQEVFLFDKSGDLIKKLGKKGKGPGEFLSIADVEFNPYTQTIDLLCNVNKTMLKFDAETGDFLSQLNLVSTELLLFPVLRFIPIGKDQFLFSNSNFYPHSDESFNQHFFIYDYKSKGIPKKWLPFKQYERRIIESVYPPLLAFHSTEGKISGHYWNSRVIYEYTKEDIFPKYQFDFGEEHVYWYDVLEPPEFDKVYEENGVCCIEPLFELDNFIYGNYRYKNFMGESFLYSKRTNKVFQFIGDKVTNPFTPHKFYFPIGTIEDGLVFSISPNQLIRDFKKNQDILIPKEKKKLEAFINKVNPNGDIVLLFYKFKSSI